uniref:CCHC-type domain-containing protein n=1 Tax=Meloidogyne incognita TaxID=6306 RepID=A0A914L3B4_MELIC
MEAMIEKLKQMQSQMLEEMKGRKSAVTKSEEEKSTELYCKLKSLIKEFQSNIEKGITFESWYAKNKSYFEVDAQSLTEEVRVRLLVEKLGRVEYAKMSQKMLPEKLEEMNFESLVGVLKKEFSDPRSKLVKRFEVMKMRCPSVEKILDFGTLVNSECEKANMDLTVEECKILVFIAGIPEKALDVRQISLRFVEKYAKSEVCTLKDLMEEVRSYLSNKSEAKMFDSQSKVKSGPKEFVEVNAVSRIEHSRSRQSKRSKIKSRQKERQVESRQCYNCGIVGHISRNCRKPKKRFKRVDSPEVNQVEVDSSVPHILTIEIPKLKEKIRKNSQKKNRKSQKSNSPKSSRVTQGSTKSGFLKKEKSSGNSSRFKEEEEVLVMNRSKNGKKVWLPGTILSKFVDGYKVKVPRLRAIVSREAWQIRPKSMKSAESRNQGSTHGQPHSQLEASSNLKDASATTTPSATKPKDEPMHRSTETGDDRK